MVFDVVISTGSNVPIYRQIVDQVRRAIASGDLAVGDQLPSVRVLAERLLVNHNTVAKAFNELVRDGVLESRHGLGAFVAKRRNVFSTAERRRRLDVAIAALTSEAVLLDFSHEELLEAVAKNLNGCPKETKEKRKA